jgi:hypothetical protein
MAIKKLTNVDRLEIVLDAMKVGETISKEVNIQKIWAHLPTTI